MHALISKSINYVMAYRDVATGGWLAYLVMSEAERDSYAIEKRSSERLCAPLYRWLVQAVVEFVGFVEN